MAGVEGRGRLRALPSLVATVLLAASYSHAEAAPGSGSMYARVGVDSDDSYVEYVWIDPSKREMHFFHIGMFYDCPDSRSCVNAGGFHFALPETCDELRRGRSWKLDGHTLVVVASYRPVPHDVIAIEVRDAQGRREAIALYSYKRGLLNYLMLEPGNLYSEHYTLESKKGVLAGVCDKPRQLDQVP